MAEYQHQPHLDSIENNLIALVDSTSALRRGFITIAFSLAETKLLLQQILHLLPPLTNQDHSHEEPEGLLDSTVIHKIEAIVEAEVFAEMLKTTSDETWMFGDNDETEFIDNEDKAIESQETLLNELRGSNLISVKNPFSINGHYRKQIGSKSFEMIGKHGVDSTERYNGVRSPNNLLESINMYYGDSVDEYIARVTLKYFDPGGRYVSHAILVRLDPSTEYIFRSGSYVHIFSENWTRGYYSDGVESIDLVFDVICKEGENCGCLRRFKAVMFCFSAFLSLLVSSIVAEPYTTTLIFHHLIASADECMILNNAALYKTCFGAPILTTFSLDVMTVLLFTASITGLLENEGHLKVLSVPLKLLKANLNIEDLFLVNTLFAKTGVLEVGECYISTRIIYIVCPYELYLYASSMLIFMAATHLRNYFQKHRLGSLRFSLVFLLTEELELLKWFYWFAWTTLVIDIEQENPLKEDSNDFRQLGGVANVETETSLIPEGEYQLNKHEFSTVGCVKYSEWSTTELSDDIEKRDFEEASDDDETTFYDSNEYFVDPTITNESMNETQDYSKEPDQFDQEAKRHSLVQVCNPGYVEIQKRKMLPDPVEKGKGFRLWSMIKNNVGKDLARVCLPVYFNEPISSLQKCFEDLEYSYLLDQAYEYGKAGNGLLRILYVAADVLGYIFSYFIWFHENLMIDVTCGVESKRSCRPMLLRILNMSDPFEISFFFSILADKDCFQRVGIVMS